MTLRKLAAAGAAVIALLLMANPAHAQEPPCPWPAAPSLLMDRPSPPDSTWVDIGPANAKVCYSRPSARTRTIFGELVEFEKPWRTGANEPTMLHLPVRAEVAGVALDPGTYILMTIPTPQSWIVTINTTDVTDPAEMFDNLTEIGRGTVPVEQLGDHIEMLTLRDADSEAEPALVIEWERTRVRVPIVALNDGEVEDGAMATMKKLTPILYVERIEPSLPFWTERLGFTVTAEVPDGDQLGFVILQKDNVEIMYQTRRSAEAEGAATVAGLPLRGTILFIETDDLTAIERAIAGADLVFPRKPTPYGAEELGVREPAGNLVVFAEFKS